jgi:hypothetical protein
MSTTKANVVAVLDEKAAGAIIWWRLTGDTNIDDLKRAWDAAGLAAKLHPSETSTAVAMQRAVAEQAGKRRLARPLAGHKGWAIVDEKPTTDDKLDYETVATIKLQGDKTTMLIEGCADQNLAAQLSTWFDYYAKRLTISDVSSWLTSLTKEVKAVSLRDTGGVYFVPRDQVATFRSMVTVIRAVSSHEIYEVPAMRSDEAVEAILASVLREAQQEVAAMETDLDTGDLKGRALKTREARCEAVTEKIESYEALLGKSMETMRDRVTSLKAAIVEAEMLAQAAAEAEKAA